MDAGRTSTGHDRLSGEERWAEYAANVGQKPKALRAVETVRKRERVVVRETRGGGGWGIFEMSSRPKARRSDRRHGAVHETFLAKAELLAREKPVARECSKKRKPPNECANDNILFVTIKLPSLWRGNECRNGNEVLRTLAAVAC